MAWPSRGVRDAVGDAIQGLTCPSCGGPATLQEGSRLGACSACGQALLAEGEVGLPRYFVAPRADERQVLEALRGFWDASDKATDLAQRARVTESFPVFVPLWHITGRVLGWVVGDVKRSSGSTYATKVRRVSRACDSENAACDLGELGVKSQDRGRGPAALRGGGGRAPGPHFPALGSRGRGAPRCGEGVPRAGLRRRERGPQSASCS